MEVHEGAAVAAVKLGSLELADGSCRAFDECLWCTQAAAPAWLQETGLPLGVPLGGFEDDSGFASRLPMESACFLLPALGPCGCGRVKVLPALLLHSHSWREWLHVVRQQSACALAFLSAWALVPAGAAGLQWWGPPYAGTRAGRCILLPLRITLPSCIPKPRTQNLLSLWPCTAYASNVSRVPHGAGLCAPAQTRRGLRLWAPTCARLAARGTCLRSATWPPQRATRGPRRACSPCGRGPCWPKTCAGAPQQQCCKPERIFITCVICL